MTSNSLTRQSNRARIDLSRNGESEIVYSRALDSPRLLRLSLSVGGTIVPSYFQKRQAVFVRFS